MTTTNADPAGRVTVDAGPRDEARPAKRPVGRRALTIAGIVVVVLVLAALWFVYGGERARQSSEEQARQRVTDSSSAPTTAVSETAFSSTPQPGLYRYQGSGRENTTFPPLVEEQGPSMPATVNLAEDGCWQFQIDYNTHHWQSWTYCARHGELTEQKNETFARRNLGGANIDNTSVFACEPPVLILRATDPPGTTHDRSCVGHGTLVPAETTAAGTVTVIGPEQLVVGGETVATVHVRYDLTYRGGQSGSETTDLWFASSTGMPMKNEHHILVDTDTPFGKITYTEDAQFAPLTLSPV
jgi:hypothetical protein